LRCRLNQINNGFVELQVNGQNKCYYPNRFQDMMSFITKELVYYSDIDITYNIILHQNLCSIILMLDEVTNQACHDLRTI
jgi:hypothetical protein